MPSQSPQNQIITCKNCGNEIGSCEFCRNKTTIESHVVDNIIAVNNGVGVDGNVGDDQEQGVKGNSSFLCSVVNMSAMLVGLGILSTPYALQKGGWASGFLLVGLGILCAYTAHLLGKCLKANNNSRTYMDIGHHAFGKKGKVVTLTFVYMELFMALVSFTISLHDNLNIVFAGKHIIIPGIPLQSSQLLTVIAVMVALPTLWLRDLSRISFLSTIGVFLSILIFIAVVFTPAFGVIKANQSIPVLRLKNIPDISGLYIFNLAGHVVFPNIYKSMEDPTEFSKVSAVSFSIITLAYTTLGFVGAKLFGPEVNSQITLSMPRHLIITKIALWATVLAPLTKYAFALVPIASQFDNKFPSSMGHRMRFFIRGSIASLLLIFVLILSLTVPYFEKVLSLTGSLVCTGMSIIFPCAFYTKILWSELSTSHIAINVVLIAFGFLMGIVGTITSLRSLVESF